MWPLHLAGDLLCVKRRIVNEQATLNSTIPVSDVNARKKLAGSEHGRSTKPGLNRMKHGWAPASLKGGL